MAIYAFEGDLIIFFRSILISYVAYIAAIEEMNTYKKEFAYVEGLKKLQSRV